VSRLVSAILGLLLSGCAAIQTTPSDEERRALTPTGKLRVGFLSTSPVHVIKDPISGELKGVAVEIGNELARRLAVPYEWVGYPSASAIEASAQAGQWDVAVFAVTPARLELMDFSPPMMEVEVGYLVPARSPLSALSDVDKPGVRIAVQEKTVADTHLSASLRSATLVRAPAGTDPVDLVASEQADALANLKPFLLRASGKLPGSRVLDGQIFADQIAIAVPKGRGVSMAYVRRFVEEAKSSGFVKDSIDRAGLRAVVVAP
jgi:polar amino acid transport system substrate-binding protein